MHASVTKQASRAPARPPDADHNQARTAPRRSSLAQPDPAEHTDDAKTILQRWNSREWEAVRYAAYRSLLDMYVHPALNRQGIPWPNALHHDAVQHGLIDPRTGQPTPRMLWLNPGLRPPGVEQR